MAKILTRSGVAWCLYDFGTSAYSTNVISFILSAYFASKIASNNITGTSQWGYTMTITAVLLAILAPFFGQYIDQKGNSRRWFLSLNIITLLCIAAWWWIHPNTPHAVMFALLLAGVSYFCYETAFVLYNGMLKTLVPKTHVGRLSGWAFAAGYVGGIICLLLVLILLIKNMGQWNFLDHSHHGIRLVGPVTAAWFLIFSLPLFLTKLKPEKKHEKFSLKQTLNATWLQITTLKNETNTLKFLLARLLYMDGLNSIFAFCGIYASGTFHMNSEDLIIFAISSQTCAFLGAMIFSKLDDLVGPLFCLRCSVTLLSLSVAVLLMVHSITLFWIAGMVLSTTIGPIQACSRSYMTHISPADEINSRFGLYALSGKVTAFLGPWLIAVTTSWTQSQRLGITPTLALILLGLLTLFFIKDE